MLQLGDDTAALGFAALESAQVGARRDLSPESAKLGTADPAFPGVGGLVKRSKADFLRLGSGVRTVFY